MTPINKQTEIVIDGKSYQVDYTYYPEIPKIAYDYDGGGHPGQKEQVVVHKVNSFKFDVIYPDFANKIVNKILELEKTKQ